MTACYVIQTVLKDVDQTSYIKQSRFPVAPIAPTALLFAKYMATYSAPDVIIMRCGVLKRALSRG